MFLNFDPIKTCLPSNLFQLIRLEAPQNRQRAVFTYQPIVQKQMTDRRIEKICDRVTMQIDYEEATLRHPIHFAQNPNRAFIIKMVQRQRLNHIIKRLG